MRNHSAARTRVAMGFVFPVAALALAALTPAQDAPQAPRLPRKDFADKPALRVLEISGFDAIVIERDGQRVRHRLSGIKAPANPGDERRAEQFLAQLLGGESVYIDVAATEAHEAARAAPRVFAYRSPDGLFVNLELVRQGYVPADADSAAEFRDQFLACEKLAAGAGKGVWGKASRANATTRASRSEPSEPSTRPSEASGGAPAANSETTVYVTKSGSRYHRKDCQHVRGGSSAIPLGEAKSRGLKPCQRCRPPE